MSAIRFRLCIALAVFTGGASSLLGQGWENPNGVCMDCGNDSSSTYNRPVYREPANHEAEEAARVERNRKLDEVNARANEAFSRGDYDAALVIFKEQQKLRNGPKVRYDLKLTNVNIAWKAAKTSAEYRRVMAAHPSFFTADNRQFVDNVEAREKAIKAEAAAQKLRDKQAAKDLKVAEKARKKAERMSASLVRPVAAGAGIKEGTAATDYFGATKADPHLEPSSGSQEAASEQMRQGFDNPGNFAGAPVVIPTSPAATEEAVLRDPRVVAAQGEMQSLEGESAALDVEIERLTVKRNAAGNTADMMLITRELDKKSAAKQEKAVQIVAAGDKVARVRRSVTTEVESKAASAQ